MTKVRRQNLVNPNNQQERPWITQRAVRVENVEGGQAAYRQKGTKVYGEHCNFYSIEIIEEMTKAVHRWPVAIGVFYYLTDTELLLALEQKEAVGLIVQRSDSWMPCLHPMIIEGERNWQYDSAVRVQKAMRRLNRKGLTADHFPFDEIHNMRNQGQRITDLPGVLHTGNFGSGDCHPKTVVCCDVIADMLIPQEALVASSNGTASARNAWNHCTHLHNMEPKVLLGIVSDWCEKFVCSTWLPDLPIEYDKEGNYIDLPVSVDYERENPTVKWDNKEARASLHPTTK